MVYRWIGSIVGMLLSLFWIITAWLSSGRTMFALFFLMLVVHIVCGYLLGRRYEIIQQMAYHDSLTGMLSHRRFLDMLEKEIERAERYDYPVTLMFLDLDDFKKYNDTHGHMAGDRLLCHFARVLQETVRNHDEVGRWGGEEFVILLPHTDTQQSLLVGERLRANIAREMNGVTASIGIATFPVHARTSNELALCADKLMYEAKKTKNCMVAGS
ncbi:GGDEF domain-containing protein [Brevibacillus fluminis]|uniref:GGDEF domain-containing protein n=2 Tax=Brevibacillus fluminis TaxID=511487 RepID=A0A3M8DV51_9BACL|nr:GGDEF domain-containing protein [Brevibacillus fluminis]